MKVIIIGGGEIGFYLAERLAKEHKDVVLVDNDLDRVQTARQELDIQAIFGNGSSPRVLKKAGIDSAGMVVAVTSSDEVNMIACLIASTQSKIPVKVARIRNLEYIHDTEILGKNYLGIDCHINPEMEAAEQILKLCEIPAAGNVLDLADGQLRLISVRLAAGSPVTGYKLRDLPEFQPQNKALICAMQQNGKTIIPTGDTVINEGDLIWLVAPQEIIHNLLVNIGIKADPIRRVMLYGGSRTSRFVAEGLLKKKIAVKIIDTDRERCEELAARLDAALVLHVPNIGVEVLKQEGIQDYSLFIATSSDDEDNILASLLAKRLGVPKAITLLDRTTYNSIISVIGVDNVLNLRITAADKILQYIRKGKVQSTVSVGETGAEAIEFEALETSEAVGKPLYKISFPKGSLVVGIIRKGEAIIPRGHDVIQPGDRVVIISLYQAIPKVEKIFQVKVNFF